MPPLPPGPPPLPAGPMLPLYPGFVPPPLPPLGFMSGAPLTVPPPPPGGPPSMTHQSFLPPPPPGFPPFPPTNPQLFVPPPPPGQPPRWQAPRPARMLQDPLSATPQQTFQGHRAMRQNVAAISVPPLGAAGSQPLVGAVAASSSAVVSAEPQLRDLKRESTAFVPTTVKKRKTTATQQIKARINAAPGATQGSGEDDEAPVVGPQRPDLMTTLRNAGVGARTVQPTGDGRHKDDYDDFLADVEDILG